MLKDTHAVADGSLGPVSSQKELIRSAVRETGSIPMLGPRIVTQVSRPSRLLSEPHPTLSLYVGTDGLRMEASGQSLTGVQDSGLEQWAQGLKEQGSFLTPLSESCPDGLRPR